MQECDVCLCEIGSTHFIQCSTTFNNSKLEKLELKLREVLPVSKTSNKLVYCQSKVCGDCFKYLTDFCSKNIIIPTCPLCKAYYLESDIVKRKDPELLKDYRKILFLAFKKQNSKSIDEFVKYKMAIEKVRMDKIDFINKKFPIAIKLLIDQTSYAKKLKIIEKNNSNFLKRAQDSLKQKCYTNLCHGFINEKNICNLCEKEFCKDCESQIKKNEIHTCKKEDVESVLFIKSIIKCPNCNVSITKSDGCNDMTCAVCNTNFIYTNGQISGGGNHGKNTKVDLKNFNSLKDSITEDLSLNAQEAIDEYDYYLENAYFKMKKNPLPIHKAGSINNNPKTFSEAFESHHKSLTYYKNLVSFFN